MPVLKNPRHERFAQEMAKGKSATEAMQLAGYSDPRNSTRLTKNDEIAARVAELQERSAKKVEVTVESIAAELEEDRQLAHKAKQAGAAVSATATKAKLFGLIKNKYEHSGSLRVDLSALSDEQLDQLEAIIGAVAGGFASGGHPGGEETAPGEA